MSEDGSLVGGLLEERGGRSGRGDGRGRGGVYCSRERYGGKEVRR